MLGFGMLAYVPIHKTAAQENGWARQAVVQVRTEVRGRARQRPTQHSCAPWLCRTTAAYASNRAESCPASMTPRLSRSASIGGASEDVRDDRLRVVLFSLPVPGRCLRFVHFQMPGAVQLLSQKVQVLRG